MVSFKYNGRRWADLEMFLWEGGSLTVRDGEFKPI